jgi:hypothetical protein
MDFMLVDSTGNAVDAFTDLEAAERALIALAADDALAAIHFAILAYNERGVAVGDPVVVADVRPEHAVRLEVEGDVEHVGLTIWASSCLHSAIEYGRSSASATAAVPELGPSSGVRASGAY